MFFSQKQLTRSKTLTAGSITTYKNEGCSAFYPNENQWWKFYLYSYSLFDIFLQSVWFTFCLIIFSYLSFHNIHEACLIKLFLAGINHAILRDRIKQTKNERSCLLMHCNTMMKHTFSENININRNGIIQSFENFLVINFYCYTRIFKNFIEIIFSWHESNLVCKRKGNKYIYRFLWINSYQNKLSILAEGSYS